MQVNNNSNGALSAHRFSARTQDWAQASVMVGIEAAALHTPTFWGLTPHQAQYEIMALGWLLWFGLARRIFTKRRPFWNELLYVVLASFALTLLTAGLSLTNEQVVSLGASVQLFSYLILAIIAGRLIAHQLLKALGLWVKPTLIFGNGNNAIQACLALRSEPWMGLAVESFVNLHAEQQRQIPTGFPAQFDWQEQPECWQLVRDYYQCVIAVEPDEAEQRDQLIRQLAQHHVNNVHVIPAMRGIPLFGLETSHFQSHEVLMIHLQNNLDRPVFRGVKRLFDLIAASVALLLLSPVMLTLAALVKRDGGPAFFGHTRIGQNGQPFKCYKFRSMVVNSQEVLAELLANSTEARAEWERDFKLKDDPRVSRIGCILRKSSLDELPQLWNVIKGDMSLVGPRPVIQAELERYGEDVSYYLEAKPGVTGLWQVSGRNDVDYDTRVYLDAWYVKNWSLWTDISILFKTVGVVLGRDGAY